MKQPYRDGCKPGACKESSCLSRKWKFNLGECSNFLGGDRNLSSPFFHAVNFLVANFITWLNYSTTHISIERAQANIVLFCPSPLLSSWHSLSDFIFSSCPVLSSSPFLLRSSASSSLSFFSFLFSCPPSLLLYHFSFRYTVYSSSLFSFLSWQANFL